MFSTKPDLHSISSEIKLKPQHTPSATDPNYPHWLLADSIVRGIGLAHWMTKAIYREAITDNPDPECCAYLSDEKRTLIVSIPRENESRQLVGVMLLAAQRNNKLDVLLQHSDGGYGPKHPLDPERVSRRMPSIQILNLLRMAEWERPLKELLDRYAKATHRLEELPKADNEVFAAVIQGSATVYREAMALSDEKLRSSLLLKASLRLQDSNPSLMLDIVKEINRLSRTEERGASRQRPEKTDQSIAQITTQVLALLQVAQLRAGIYASQHEYAAAVAVLNDYADFFEATIVPAIDLFITIQSDKSHICEQWQQLQALDLFVPPVLSDYVRPLSKEISLGVFEKEPEK